MERTVATTWAVGWPGRLFVARFLCLPRAELEVDTYGRGQAPPRELHPLGASLPAAQQPGLDMAMATAVTIARVETEAAAKPALLIKTCDVAVCKSWARPQAEKLESWTNLKAASDFCRALQTTPGLHQSGPLWESWQSPQQEVLMSDQVEGRQMERKYETVGRNAGPRKRLGTPARWQ